MPDDDTPIYAAWEKGWTPGPCPECGFTATGHVVLFGDPEPEPPTPDERRPIGEGYMHGGTREDCVLPPELAAAFRSLEKPG